MPSRKPNRKPAVNTLSPSADANEASAAPPDPLAPSAPPPAPVADADPAVAVAVAVAPAASHEPILERGQPMLEPLTAYELSPKILLGPDGGGDRAFAADLDESVRDFGSTRNMVRVCEWCNTPLADAEAATCPSCGANLKPVEPDAEIPGLTTMTLEAVLARRRAEAQQQATSNAATRLFRGAPAAPPVTSPASLQLDDATIEEAIKPPDDAVRRAMIQLEIEALQAHAPGVAAGGLDPAAVAAEVAAEAGVTVPPADVSSGSEPGPAASPETPSAGSPPAP